ncbi:hypothetical protein B0A55_00074 [Friedmanniomyces simplex]|uniref:Uncharacterized protein n=1 Tax=Friedmanniomyces simplex TaxID=329884 RepID=A0A4U0Y0E1_9PEZI|nr:hypothetical protein B0A55_00074 [Friedmanniomyces simplex]
MSSRTVVPEPTSADSETLLRNRHAQLFLRPEVMEETKALFAQHALQQGLQLNRKACDNFIVSFLPIYGPVLWRNAKASRQHLLNRGAAAPQYRAYRLRDPEVTAFALYRQRSATYPNDARAMLGHVDGESLAERYWQQLPNAGKAFWEEQAREHNKALEMYRRKLERLLDTIGTLLHPTAMVKMYFSLDALPDPADPYWTFATPWTCCPDIGLEFATTARAAFDIDTLFGMEEDCVRPWPRSLLVLGMLQMPLYFEMAENSAEVAASRRGWERGETDKAVQPVAKASTEKVLWSLQPSKGAGNWRGFLPEFEIAIGV